MRRCTFVALVLAALAGTGASALAAPAASPSDGGTVDRVLVFSIPYVAWEDIEDTNLPNLEAFFAESGVADLATRASRHRRTTHVGDGYVTFGAGTRAVGDVDTDGEGFGVDEPYGRDSAGTVFARRTGITVESGLVQLGIAEIIDHTDAELYDAVPGALGEALADAGHPTAVVANADGTEPAGIEPEYRRQAVSSLMDDEGVVPGGRVDAGLLEADPAAPYGLRLDHEEVLEAFGDAWDPASVVLVEASDLVRAGQYSELTTSAQGDRLRTEALTRSDELLGALLEQVDPERDAVLVVSPAHPVGDIRLTVAALRAPGIEPGLLRSPTTRRSGFVQLTDVAPTVLDLLDVEVPSSMSGRSFEAGSTGGDLDDRIGTLADADEAARFIGDQVETIATVFVVLDAVVVAGFALWAMGRVRFTGTRQTLRFGALGVLGLVPATFLARLVPFHQHAAILYWLFLVATALVLAVLWARLDRRHELAPVCAASATIVVLMALDAVTGSRLQLSSALGNSPIVAGRFTGFGNLAYAAFSSAGLVLAVIVAAMRPGRRGVWSAIGLLIAVLALDGAPFWGSDVGGLLSMGPAFLVTSLLLLGWRIRFRSAVLVAAATALLVATVGVVDLARPAESRTHLGRLFETIGDDGWSGLSTVLERKLDANLGNITNTQWVYVLLIAAVLVVVAGLTMAERLRELGSRYPALRAGAVGAATLLVLGFALNDSGALVPGVMLTVFDSVFIVLLTGATRPVKART